MKSALENIRQSQFVKNVSVLATGTLIVQVITTLLSPVLSRLYSPEDYGLFAVFTSLLNILTVIGSLRYELAMLIPKKTREAALILKLSLYLVLIISVIVFLITLIFNRQFAGISGSESLGFHLYFLAPVFLAAGSVQAFTYWYNRNKIYSLISGVRIFQSSVNSAFSITLGFLKFHSSGLIFSLVVSNILSLIFLIKKSALNFKSCSFDFKALKSVAVKYREFPLLGLPGALLDTVSINSVIFLLSYFFSEAVTGSYSFAYRMLTLPSVLISASIGQVLFQKLSESYSNKEIIFTHILKTWKFLFLAGLIPLLILMFSGEEIFRFVFGEKWSEAGKISEYLCILTFFMFISSPTSSAMIVLRKQKFMFWNSLAVFIYRPLALYYGYASGNFMNGIILFVILEVIQILFFNFILVRNTLISDRGIKS